MNNTLNIKRQGKGHHIFDRRRGEGRGGEGEGEVRGEGKGKGEGRGGEREVIGEGRREVGQQLKKMRTRSYAKITIAQVFSSTAISFLFQLKKKNCKCSTYKKRETERETAVFFFTRKKIFCRETKAKPLSEMQ